MTIDKSILLKYKTMRKCFSCKQFICLEEEWNSDNKIIHYTKGVYHRECLKKEMLKSKRVKRNEEEVEIEIDRLVRDSDLLLYNVVVKNHLYKWAMEKYRLILLPNYIFTKLESMFKGEYKNMSKPLKPEHLLEMFERQEKFLDGIYHNPPLSGIEKLNYDIAVLVNKYEKFLDWKGKAENQSQKAQEFTNDKKPDIKIINNNKKKEEVGIFSDLEEGDD